MAAETTLRLPRRLTPDRFLSEFWQKRPLYLPDALPGFRPRLSADELAGLACEPDVESRLVFTETAEGRVRYRAETGPFDPDVLAGLPERDWTLLVHDLDRHLPELRPLLLAPRLLPAWRMGDLMASVAAPGGSVGPHCDSYDVFLLQGEGLRRWRLGSGEPAPADSELRLLRGFRVEAEYRCAPGDVLYVPPGAGHHGVAETLCTTWSLGLQAPLIRDLALLLDLDAYEIPADLRYADPDLASAECRGGLIHAAAIRRCRALLPPTAAERSDGDIAEALGRLVTLPKPEHRADPLEADEVAALIDAAAGGAPLRVAPSACHGDCGSADGRWFFAGGESFPVPEVAWPLACRLAGQEGAAGTVIAPAEVAAAQDLISVLGRHGLLEPLPG